VHRVGEVGEHLPGRLHQHPQHALLHIRALLIAANTIEWAGLEVVINS
jgi:hypothetical protein